MIGFMVFLLMSLLALATSTVVLGVILSVKRMTEEGKE